MSVEASPSLDDERGHASAESDYDEYLVIPGDIDTVSGEVAEHRIPEDGSDESSSWPFSRVHKPPQKFKASDRTVFIPGVPIELKFTGYERTVTTHLLNPNLYTIELKHGDFSWTIKKRYKHIQHLHQQLRIYRATLNIPFPTKAHKEKRQSYKMNTLQNKLKNKGALPRFPETPDALVADDRIEARMQQLEQYLSSLLQINIYRNHYETVSFFEVSHLTFIRELGIKGMEGMILKRTGSTHYGRSPCSCCGLCNCGLCARCRYLCGDIFGGWRTRWLIVKESFIAYIYPKDGTIKGVILFDHGFEISSGMFSTGLRNGLYIRNSSREFIVKCPTQRIAKEWMSFVKEMTATAGLKYIQGNRYRSFAPVRSSITANWFVDGCDYMSAVADVLEQAKEEIFITDWWLSPEIQMKRPAVEGDRWRLDNILYRKAAQGVKVFVLLYKEVELALGINSFYSKQRLVGGHSSNIKVLRHPDQAKVGMFFLWAHHEKIVVVDQSYAFVAGIDLCYGRWDDYRHRLTDLGSAIHLNPKVHSSSVSLPLTDSPPQPSANGLSAKLDVRNRSTSEIDGINDSPKPERSLNQKVRLRLAIDETMMNQPSPENIKCETPEPKDKSLMEKVKTRGREFMSQWSTDSPTLSSDEESLAGDGPSKNDKTKSAGESPMCKASSIIPEVNPMLSNLTGCAKLWFGKDYTNFIVKDFHNLDLPYQDLVDRNHTPRMPWHDIGVMVTGNAARDVARHFIQRWNAIKVEKAKLNPLYPYLLPKADKEYIRPIRFKNSHRSNVKCQVVRSVGHWSAGFLDEDLWEGSIHEAYVDIIAKSRHYIYIENQFFITSCGNPVQNQVGNALYKRILRAYREKTVFRVFIIIPLLPGFEGEVGSPSATALNVITYWNYCSISRGNNSIISRLKAAGIADPSEYITFHGLRNHSVLNEDLVTELIYVHSKLLIADDDTVICGSANINDRSMMGKRDSELALVIQDAEFKEGVMNGKPTPSGRFAGSLRRRLFREHLGILGGNCSDLREKQLIDVSDPIAHSFYHDVWRKFAASNTTIFEEVFNCMPTDRAVDFLSLKRFQEEIPLCRSDKEAAKEKLKNIQGHLVDLPLNFLQNETLTPSMNSIHGIIPTAVWL
ncbi:unnamed protein product [Bemisia tabaci]|uniref:Phospholipase n=1 Tax=Bemisia tabaci TaxID=7038 RepID=A0A9P0AN62_BEMTA|nr:unnamed protein product [Bemisia tabaci]